jgi:hypothetical protein
MKTSISTLTLLLLTFAPPVALAADDGLSFTLERTVAHSGFDGDMCWVHARAGVIPAGGHGNESDAPLAVMTMQKLLLSGSDVFYALNETRSSDGGDSWTAPSPLQSFARQTVGPPATALPTGASIAPHLLQAADETTVCDFAPQWHAASQRLLGLGQTVWYRGNRVMHLRPRGVAYAVYEPKANRWSAWQTVKLPAETKFQDAGSGSVQRFDLPGGDVLIPIYFKDPAQKQYSVTVCRCRFDGRTIEFVEHGNEMTIPIKRGLYEPSLTKFRGRYYLTLRNDDHGYVTTAEDGLHFSTPRRWTFDDGQDLGNYNTQQHWVTHSDGLFLVYTRRGANNDHVFRHRAPLFIARVDPEKLQVIRSSEQVLVPERGARLGNFGVTRVSPEETWVTVTEWMQPKGVEKHGSDNSLFVAKLKWNRPNRLATGGTFEQGDADSAQAAGATDAWEKIQPYFSPPERWKHDFGDYASPLKFADGARVRTPNDWRRRRAEIAAEWEELLGKWPPLITDPKLEIL